jgi:hypothetical protein
MTVSGALYGIMIIMRSKIASFSLKGRYEVAPPLKKEPLKPPLSEPIIDIASSGIC